MPSVQETVKRIICEEVRFQILFLNWILSITRLLSDRFVFSKLFFIRYWLVTYLQRSIQLARTKSGIDNDFEVFVPLNFGNFTFIDP